MWRSSSSLLLCGWLFVGCSDGKLSPTTPSSAVIQSEIVADKPNTTNPIPIVVDLPAPPIKACDDVADSSVWWEEESSSWYYHNGCDVPLNYVSGHFKINTAVWSTDQTLLSLTEKVSAPNTYERQSITGLTACSQPDLWVGITIADIESGRVLIHPKDETAENVASGKYVAPIAGRSGPLGAECEPPPTACVPGTVYDASGEHGDGTYTITFRVREGINPVALTVWHSEFETFLPQDRLAVASGVYGAGGPYQLTVPLIGYVRQVDALCGTFIPEVLTVDNIDQFSAQIFLYWYNGADQPYYVRP